MMSRTIDIGSRLLKGNVVESFPCEHTGASARTSFIICSDGRTGIVRYQRFSAMSWVQRFFSLSRTNHVPQLLLRAVSGACCVVWPSTFRCGDNGLGLLRHGKCMSLHNSLRRSRTGNRTIRLLYKMRRRTGTR